jgi:uncharacterized protein with HEPN domain
MVDDDLIRLKHMRDAAEEALGFVVDKSRRNLNTDRQLDLALTKSIEIIGEASAKVSAHRKDEWAEIPWRDIVAMRNRLIHAYFDVDLDILWQR